MATALAAAERSDVAVKGLFSQLLIVMQENTAGIINSSDSERLHDYRIAVRRSRTLLGQLPQVLPKRMTERYGNHFAKLGTLTAPLRDLDVLLLKFESYRQLLPQRLQGELDLVLRLIETERQQLQQQLIKQLQSAHYQRFINSWQDYLHSNSPDNTTLANATRPAKALADDRIWKIYKKALQQGKRITKNSPANDLHTLRKRCKKLRYLIESFQPLYPEQQITHLITVLKQLQDHLGEFQDLHVHHDIFQRLRTGLEAQQPCDKALKRLIQALDKQQHKQREHFHDCFNTFANKPHQKEFRALFKR
jgi:CHAD domain-containing protein